MVIKIGSNMEQLNEGKSHRRRGKNTISPHRIRTVSDINRNQGVRNEQSSDPHRLMRIPEILDLLPISKSTWWDGVKSGRFPASVKLGPRTTAWRAEDIYDLIESLSGEN